MEVAPEPRTVEPKSRRRAGWSADGANSLDENRADGAGREQDIEESHGPRLSLRHEIVGHCLARLHVFVTEILNRLRIWNSIQYHVAVSQDFAKVVSG